MCARLPAYPPTRGARRPRRAIRLPGCPRGRAAFLEVASLDFYRKRPRRLRLGRGTAFFPKESGGKERAGGVPPASPQTGAHGGGWLYGQGKNRACIAARFMGSHVSGAVAPWVARIAVTPQALGTCALYRVRPPGRRRCYASEKAWRFRRLGDAAADRISEGRSRVVVRMQFCT